MQLVVYDAKFAELQIKMNRGTCENCKKESYTVKKCTRCGVVKYCNRTCQRQNFPKHKEFCLLWSQFEGAKNIIRPELKQLLLGQCGKMGFSYYWGSLPDLTRFNLIGQRLCVIVQIISVLPAVDLLSFDVTARDVANQSALIKIPAHLFDILSACFLLQPGRFLLLLNVPLAVLSYSQKISCVFIETWDQAKFIA